MIVSAAIRKNGIIYSVEKPGRHHNIIHNTPKLEVGNPASYVIDGEQGFLTDEGKFLNRNDSENHARACGQLVGKLIGSVCTSEDLW